MPSADAKIAVLQSQMTDVKKQIDAGFSAIGEKLDRMSSDIQTIQVNADKVFASKDELTGLRESLRADLDVLRKKTGINKVLGNVLTAIISPVVVYLIIFAITHR